MANVLTVDLVARLEPETSGLPITVLRENDNVRNPASDILIDKQLSIGTSEEQIELDDVASPGEVYIRNLDDTNYVRAGATTGQYATRVLAGRFAFFPLEGTTLFVIADTASVSVRIVVFSL